jgi:hypothetical protein
VSPSGKATDFDSVMRWFESSHPSHLQSTTQIIEWLFFILIKIIFLSSYF